MLSNKCDFIRVHIYTFSPALIFTWRTTLISLIDSCTFGINPSYIIHSRKRWLCCTSSFTFSHEDRHVHKIEFYFTNHYCSTFIIERKSLISSLHSERALKTRKWFNLVNFHFIVVSQYFFTTSLFMISCCCCVLWRWIIFSTSRVGWAAKIFRVKRGLEIKL